MNRGMVTLTSLGVGAGIMYFADPQEGRRRRARVRDAMVHASHTVEAAASTVSRDMENRLAGVVARTTTSLTAQPAPLDDVLAARVRSRVGRLVSHPGAIEVKAAAGVITLSGPVFEAEIGQLVNGVRAVPGVISIENRLEPHAEAGDVPALQGPGPRSVPAGPAHLRWTPTTRVMAGAAGLALIALASRRHTMRGTAVSLAGFELLEQAFRGRRAVA